MDKRTGVNSPSVVIGEFTPIVKPTPQLEFVSGVEEQVIASNSWSVDKPFGKGTGVYCPNVVINNATQIVNVTPVVEFVKGKKVAEMEQFSEQVIISEAENTVPTVVSMENDDYHPQNHDKVFERNLKEL